MAWRGRRAMRFSISNGYEENCCKALGAAHCAQRGGQQHRQQCSSASEPSWCRECPLLARGQPHHMHC
jgi:hypothetical protein